MEVKSIIDQIEYLSKKLSRLGEEDEYAKKFMLYELNRLCLDLIEKIRIIESDRELLSHKEDKIAKQRARIQELSQKIAQLKHKLLDARREARAFNYSNEDLHQQLLKAKEKMLADYLAIDTSKQIDPTEKRSQLFNW
jgi:uncharacterized protein YigA (DUF484 family)